MPRPGPRPYECIRRAWHSDGHQPLRGALIQDIFRVVNELHSISTRRKKEWQEKLPIVVLRAEEILYSKANTESEYADVETLRARLDDAVDTMIRRDETEEKGVYLAPCVEAALSLGCTPKKVPRGQRQVPSRFSANATRRHNSLNGGHKAAAGDRSTQMRSVHEKSTNSSLRIVDTQIQDQGLKSATSMETSSFYSSPLAPNMGHNGSFHPAFATPAPFDAACPFMTTFPQLGSLVQFLKGGDDVSMRAESLHANRRDLRAQQYDGTIASSGDAHFACRDFTTRADGSITNTNIAMQMSLPVMDTRMVQQTATPGDIFSVDTHMNPHMLRLSTTLDPWHTKPIPTSIPSPLSTNFHNTPILPVNGDASSQACNTDLQLRLGPPGKETSTTSGMMGSSTSASKRLRVDIGKLAP